MKSIYLIHDMVWLCSAGKFFWCHPGWVLCLWSASISACGRLPHMDFSCDCESLQEMSLDLLTWQWVWLQENDEGTVGLLGLDSEPVQYQVCPNPSAIANYVASADTRGVPVGEGAQRHIENSLDTGVVAHDGCPFFISPALCLTQS
jgi:hypothetical protein